MWSTNLTINLYEDKIIDVIKNITTKTFKYVFPHLFQYKHLYLYLGQIVSENMNKKINVRDYGVTFILNYMDKRINIEDWNKYLLNKDNITINLKLNNNVYYTLVDSFDKKELYRSSDILDLYDYCKNLNEHDYALFIYKNYKHELKLIDVLENSTFYLNRCINRLIHKYNY